MKKLFSHSKKAGREVKWHFNQLNHIIKDGGVFELCDECKVLGYCKLSIQTEPIAVKAPAFNIKKYFSLVPLRIEGFGYGKFSKFHLQTACDAFHQEDYETAVLNFRAVTEETRNFSEAFIGAALSYFMLKDYENASIFIERYRSTLYYYQGTMIDKFINEIDRRMLENNIQEKEEVEDLFLENLIKPKDYALQNG